MTFQYLEIWIYGKGLGFIGFFRFVGWQIDRKFCGHELEISGVIF